MDEEAIKILKDILEEATETEDSICYVTSGDADALKAAIQALEQQPCEDCISRQAVLDNAYAYGNGLEPEGYCVNVEDIQALPPVTPLRPKGKWIHWTDDYKDYVTCSCCEYGEEGEVLLSDKTPFCPICGADMREGEDEE